MAVLISSASGNFTDASTWSLVDPNSFLDSSANNTAATSSYVYSGTFFGSSAVVDGVALKVAGRAVSPVPSGTVAVELFNVSDAVPVTVSSILITDIPHTSATPYVHGWFLFKFSGAYTLLSGKRYKLGVKSTATNSNITLYRNATAGNWSRMFRTTGTNVAPGTGDMLHIMGEYGFGSNSYSVLMNNTGTTSYGTVASDPAGSIDVSSRGTLTWATGSSTYFRWRGPLQVCENGTLEIGTNLNPIPAGYSAILEMDGSVAGDTSLIPRHGSTVVIYGTQIATPHTLLTVSVGGYCSVSGANVTALEGSQSFLGLTGTIVINAVSYTILSVTDATHLTLTGAAAGGSSFRWYHPGTSNVITVEATSGWSVGDNLCFATSYWDRTDFETALVLSVDSGTQATLSSSLTKAHLGIPPVMQSEVGNLTRNVKIKSRYPPLGGYFATDTMALVRLRGVEFLNLGTSSNFKIESKVFSMSYCAMNTSITTTQGIYIEDDFTDSIEVSYNVVYNHASSAYRSTLQLSARPHTVLGNLFTQTFTSSNAVVNLGNACGVFQDNRVCGYGQVAGIYVGPNDFGLGTFKGNRVHGTQQYAGLSLHNLGLLPSVVEDHIAWQSNSGVFIFSAQSAPITINNLKAYACGAGLQIGVNSFVTLNNAEIAGVLYQSSYAIANSAVLINENAQGAYLWINSGVLSKTGGMFTLPAISSIRLATDTTPQIFLSNTIWSSPYTAMSNDDTIVNLTQAGRQARIAVQKSNGTVGANALYLYYGTVISDTEIYDVVPSVRLCPEAGQTLSASFTVLVANGNSATVSVKTRESVLADGAAYNGARPALYVKRNAAGITADTLLATATAAGSGAFETLTGLVGPVTDNAVLDLYVACGGTGYTTGWVNMDTAAYPASVNTGNFDYWKEGSPYALNAGAGAGGAGPTSITYAG